MLASVLAGAAWVTEFEIVGLRGGHLWLESHAAPLPDAAGGMTILVIANDITRRRRGQAARRALQEHLREAQRIEAIGTLASGIAHDFNNVLGAISGNTALALADLLADHPAVLSLAQIEKAFQRARQLVRQILTFNRGQPPELKTQPLRPLLGETISVPRSTLPAMVDLQQRIDEKPLHVSADGTQIEQVLMNLCTNAWHSLPGGSGRIVVGLDIAMLDTAVAQRLGLPAAGRYAHLWVGDAGSGIEAAIRARIFGPFFSTKPKGRGTGLGLAVVHGIVGTHRGAIDVDSTAGQGSTLHVYLPLVEPAAESQPAGSAPTARAPSTGQHVLYVDDDEVMALVVEWMLQRAGYQVIFFLSAADALTAVR